MRIQDKQVVVGKWRNLHSKVAIHSTHFMFMFPLLKFSLKMYAGGKCLQDIIAHLHFPGAFQCQIEPTRSSRLQRGSMRKEKSHSTSGTHIQLHDLGQSTQTSHPNFFHLKNGALSCSSIEKITFTYHLISFQYTAINYSVPLYLLSITGSK